MENRTTRLVRGFAVAGVALFLVVGAAFGANALTHRALTAFDPTHASAPGHADSTTGTDVEEHGDKPTGTKAEDQEDSTTGTSADQSGDFQGEHQNGQQDKPDSANQGTNQSGDHQDSPGQSGQGGDSSGGGD